MILKRNNPLDAVILMLGTNDCKSAFHASPEKIGKGIELCLDEIEEYLLPWYSVDNGFLHVHEIIKEKLMEVTYVEA
jgi:lysophospholipase L1-like esterase